METAIREAPEITEDLTDDDLLHGAHTLCQMDSPFVTLVCGKVSGWEEMTDNLDATHCPLCWNAETCPICGIRLYRGGA